MQRLKGARSSPLAENRLRESRRDELARSSADKRSVREERTMHSEPARRKKNAARTFGMRACAISPCMNCERGRESVVSVSG